MESRSERKAAPTRGRSLVRPAAAAGAVLMLAAALFFSSLHPSQAEPAKASAAGPPKGLPVEVSPVEVAPLIRDVSAVGTLQPDESVVIASEIAGRVVEIPFREGERVQAGEVLARLDASIQEAERDRARATLALAEANYRRAEALLQDQAISQRERDEAFAQWRLSEAELRLTEAQLAKTVIRAPFSGVVGLRNVSLGKYLNPGEPIVTLSAVDPVKVDFRVPEVFARELKPGQTIQVTVDAMPGSAFPGKVYAIDPQLDAGGRSVLLRARIANDRQILSPGMFTRVSLVLEERQNALVIPEEALIAQPNGQPLVYKVVDGQVVAAPVTLGLRRKGKVEILDGVSQGDTIITAGHIKVRPGMPVTVMPHPAVTAETARKGD